MTDVFCEENYPVMYIGATLSKDIGIVIYQTAAE